MQIVPIIPQAVTSIEDKLEVKGISAVKPAKPVQERTLPPMVSHRQEHPENPNLQITRQEKRQELQLGERRLICRRVIQTDILNELRSHIDRRQRNQRNSDLRLHIDEEV